MKRSASIRSLSFSHDSKFLVLSSNTETIHVFKVVEDRQVEGAGAEEGAETQGKDAQTPK